MRRERGEPFSQKFPSRDRAAPVSNSLVCLIGRGHLEGTLNLSNKGLKFPPPEVFNVSLCGESTTVKFWETSPLIKLDLSFNEMKTVPPDVGLLNDLQIFKCRHNELRDLSPEFWGCLKLRHLDLAQNKLSMLDSRIGQLTDLRELLVFENSLSRIPESLGGLQLLQVLDVSRNKLTAFSPMVLPALVSLNVSHNLLQNLPDELSSFTALESLDCKANKLLDLPDLSRLTQLSRLDALENKIAAMPRLPSALTFLNLGANSLKKIDSHTLLRQTKLSELHLAGNQLMLLEPTLLDSCRLTIKVIDVTNNSLTDVPDALGHMPLLHKILASGNPIRAIRQSLLASQAAGATERLKEYLRTRGPGGAATMTVFQQPARGGGGSSARVVSSTDEKVHLRIRDSRIDSLDLSLMQMSCLADAFARLQASPHLLDESQQNVGIFKLSLAGNHFEHYPPELCSMPYLQALDLSSNRLGLGISPSTSHTSHVVSTLPPSLTCIDLSKNNLATVPPFSTPRLQILNLSVNCLAELSPSSLPGLSQLNQLRELSLANNRIRSLAGIDWGSFSSLETLNLSNNFLSNILCLAPARTLQTLMLDNNSLSFEGSSLPTFLGRFDRLQALSFHGNPQRVVRMAILDKGTEAIKEFLRLRE